MRPAARTALTTLALALASASMPAPAAELVTLSPETWDEYVPEGKEVDAIYGDFVLRNERVVAVVARPVAGRNANMMVKNVGGGIIDLTVRDRPSDQISAFYPGGQQETYRYDGAKVADGRVDEVRRGDAVQVTARGSAVSLRLRAEPAGQGPAVTVTYTLEDGAPGVRVETTFTNKGAEPVGVELFDAIRADRTFEAVPNGEHDLFWTYDAWFGQAYGVVGEGLRLQSDTRGNSSTLRYLDDGRARITLEPEGTYRLARRIIPGGSVLDVRGQAARLAGEAVRDVTVTVTDTTGAAVPGAEVALTADDRPYGSGRTGAAGRLRFALPAGREYTARVADPARGEKAGLAIGGDATALDVALEPPALVVATISGQDGGPIPCKVQFLGKDGTADPEFGPDSGEHGVRNVHYSPDGRFRRAIAPGRYEVIISYGPEYDAVFTAIEARRGAETPLEATLVRSVDTTGWISADFHSHSTPSGDNTASQYGRVLNLLCEHIEFAPCTEHNRISTYVPHLERMKARARMATCSGMELTGGPLPLNHQNAFPLEMRPRTQDNGAPLTDEDPEVQIERLAMWDDSSDKLVQVNHPDIGWMFYDRDGDFSPDGGYPKMAATMDVIEVHPPQTILDPPTTERDGKVFDNRIVNWLQLLNQGRRIPAVVNTDAHYNFHGSGWLRNYLRSPTDDPAEVETMDVVRAAEAGHVVVSNGPFLRVAMTAASGGAEAIPGDDLAAPGGKAELRVQVQRPNWFDINRVQVLINGRPAEGLNFTRESTPDRFGAGPVAFEQTLPIALGRDAHVIVVAIGEGESLGRVMGPAAGKSRPAAVSNPIYVDVDGGGFTPNGDTLGTPLPVKSGRPAAKPAPATTGAGTD